jgi:hypothetical protein
LGEIWRMTEGNRLQYDFFGWWTLKNFHLICFNRLIELLLAQTLPS